MNKIFTLLLIIILSVCNSSRNASIETLIESGDLEELKKRKKEYVDAMNTMKVELNEINNGISLLLEILSWVYKFFYRSLNILASKKI